MGTILFSVAERCPLCGSSTEVPCKVLGLIYLSVVWKCPLFGSVRCLEVTVDGGSTLVSEASLVSWGVPSYLLAIIYRPIAKQS